MRGLPRARRSQTTTPNAQPPHSTRRAVRAKDIANPFVAGVALNAAVALRGRRGPPDQALALFREAIAHWRATGNRALIVTTLRNLVVLLARIGQDEPAAVLAATLEHTAPAKTYGAEAERIATALATARQRLGDAAYAHAWDTGGAGRWRKQPTRRCTSSQSTAMVRRSQAKVDECFRTCYRADSTDDGADGWTTIEQADELARRLELRSVQKLAV
jgi:hypothetical protein